MEDIHKYNLVTDLILVTMGVILGFAIASMKTEVFEQEKSVTLVPEYSLEMNPDGSIRSYEQVKY